MSAPTGAGERHWDGVLDAVDSGPGLEAWRAQSDFAVGALLDRWVPLPAGEPEGSCLKTDLFDEACGSGMASLLNRRFERVAGIDVALPVVEAAAAANCDIEAAVADVRQLPYADGEFDCVLSNSTLDHFDGPRDVALALAELARVLKPGGRLVVTLDNPHNPLIAIRERLPEASAASLRGVGYGSGWTCGSGRLSELVSDAGLTVADRAAIVHAPRFLVARLGDRARGAGGGASRWVRRAEGLGRLPTRWLSGHFVAVLGIR